MSADLALATNNPVPTKNPFEAARLALIKALSGMKAPKAYPCAPQPSDHETIADHLREAAAIFDVWLAAVGAEVRDNTTRSVSAGLFSGSFVGAIDGNETFACDEAAEALREERMSMRRAS